jgi:hypothetical protein
MLEFGTQVWYQVLRLESRALWAMLGVVIGKTMFRERLRAEISVALG